MQSRFFLTVGALAVLAVVALIHPGVVEAQLASAAGPRATAAQLQTYTQERAARWSRAAPVIRCAPAPLTERPGSAQELARPRVTPLEEAFFDAARVKRTFASRHPDRPLR